MAITLQFGSYTFPSPSTSPPGNTRISSISYSNRLDERRNVRWIDKTVTLEATVMCSSESVVQSEYVVIRNNLDETAANFTFTNASGTLESWTTASHEKGPHVDLSFAGDSPLAYGTHIKFTATITAVEAKPASGSIITHIYTDSWTYDRHNMRTHRRTGSIQVKEGNDVNTRESACRPSATTGFDEISWEWTTDDDDLSATYSWNESEYWEEIPSPATGGDYTIDKKFNEQGGLVTTISGSWAGNKDFTLEQAKILARNIDADGTLISESYSDCPYTGAHTFSLTYQKDCKAKSGYIRWSSLLRYSCRPRVVRHPKIGGGKDYVQILTIPVETQTVTMSAERIGKKPAFNTVSKNDYRVDSIDGPSYNDIRYTSNGIAIYSGTYSYTLNLSSESGGGSIGTGGIGGIGISGGSDSAAGSSMSVGF